MFAISVLICETNSNFWIPSR